MLLPKKSKMIRCDDDGLNHEKTTEAKNPTVVVDDKVPLMNEPEESE